MSFDLTSSELQLIWDSFIEFESFSREADGDLNYFIEKWKEKMGKAMSAGIQIPDLLLGLKLIEKANLIQEHIECVISKLGSSYSSSESFLAQVVKNIREQRNISGRYIVGNGKERAKNPRSKEFIQEIPSTVLELNSNLISCSKCSLDFVNAESLSKHCLELHPELEKIELFNAETKLNSVPDLLKCPYCDKNFTLVESLKVQMKTHDSGVISEYETFVQILGGSNAGSNAETPKNDCLKDDEIKIEIMGDVAFQSDNNNCQLENSLDINLNSHPCGAFTCNTCQKDFATSGDLKEHMETHQTKPDHFCPHCDKAHKSRFGLYLHLQRKHKSEPINFDEDPEGFKPVHVVQRSHCEICYRLISNINMGNHMKTHTRVRVPFKCSICEKEFLQANPLRRHMETHTTTRIKCSLCEKTFKTKRGINEHMKKIHDQNYISSEGGSGVVTFSDGLICDESNDDSSTKEEISIELEMNSNLVSCSKCSVKFMDHESLSKHYRDSHPEVEKQSQSDSGLVKCPYCDKNFTLLETLEVHLKIHDKDVISKSESVAEEMSDSLETDRENQIDDAQMNVRAKRKIFSDTSNKSEIEDGQVKSEEDPQDCKPIRILKRSYCEICYRLIANGRMAEHMKTHNRDPLKCTICQREFQKSKYLRRHMEYHNPTRIECSLCDQTLKTKFEMKNHMKKVHDKKDMNTEGDNEEKKSRNTVMKSNCEICCRLISNANMAIHMKTHTRDPFKCSICEKEFQQAKPFRRHMEYHKPTRVKCPLCDKMLKTKYEMRSHVKRVHEKKDVADAEEKKKPCSTSKANMQYPCEICGKFVDNGRMGVHMKSHGHKVFECSICQKQFKTKSHLKQHLPTHNETNEYICSYCGKKYKTKMSLYEHNMSQHSKRRPLPCKFCKKVFFSYGLRTFHIRAHHTGEKPYKCDFCDKRFYISSRKTQHMRYHTDEKPYQCHICGKYFREGNTRKRHIRNVHKEVQPDDV